MVEQSNSVYRGIMAYEHDPATSALATRIRAWLTAMGIFLAALHIATSAVSTIAGRNIAGFGLDISSISQHPLLLSAVSAQTLAHLLILIGCIGWHWRRLWARLWLSVAAIMLVAGLLGQQVYLMWLSDFQYNRVVVIQLLLSMSLSVVYQLIYPVLLLVVINHKEFRPPFAGFEPILMKTPLKSDEINP